MALVARITAAVAVEPTLGTYALKIANLATADPSAGSGGIPTR
jgi:hypothetical protein